MGLVESNSVDVLEVMAAQGSLYCEVLAATRPRLLRPRRRAPAFSDPTELEFRVRRPARAPRQQRTADIRCGK